MNQFLDFGFAQPLSQTIPSIHLIFAKTEGNEVCEALQCEALQWLRPLQIQSQRKTRKYGFTESDKYT